MSEKAKIQDYNAPAGGWGSVRAVASILTQEEVTLLGSEILLKQNKPGGFMCVSCSWAKPAQPHPFEFCENGAKATAWEITGKTVGPEFFARHTLTELRTWSDHQLEEQGRLTHPMRYDAASDRYLPVGWDEAFGAIGAELKALDPRKVVMYTSGRASLETSYMYQLFGRMYGTNNFPDSSNMCHESTSVALPEVIGVPVGTVLLDDYDKADCILFFGQNTTTNSPRMLHPLQRAAQRGVPIITFNPLRERGLERFTNPQNPIQMVLTGGTRISTQYHQLRVGGDGAALLGLCKAVIEADDAAIATKGPRVLDVAFIEQHTSGFDDFASYCRQAAWHDIEHASGLGRTDILEAAKVYASAHAVIANYGMGITQHRHGVETAKMIVNLLLLRGNIGRPGAGISPVRGHSNVQGQRTVGISEKTKLVPLDRLAELYNFEPPRWDGLSTVDACEAIIKGDVKGFVGLGGNFLRAVPETSLMEPAWSRLRLSVQIATKLNRTHLVPGEHTYLLPCLGRIEIDRQASGPQAVAMEDSTTCIHGSRGQRQPVAEGLLSEPAIVAGLAKATLAPNPNVDWDRWVGDYALIRDAIEQTYPDQFKDFNVRLFEPGGFPRPLGARERKWKTKTGKANFTVPKAALNPPEQGNGVFQLMTLRADGQFNTTIYNEDDRFRGVSGGRMVVFMNVQDIGELGLAQGDMIRLSTVADDGVERSLGGLQVVAFDIPRYSVAAYYPECNGLIPLWHYAEGSKVPAAKSVPVRIRRDAAG
ncbi:putative formate dehydrogenase (C-terminal), related to acid resistance with formate dehydrogenase/DMSO reductase, domains 1-3 and ADC-like domain [Bradyrhizobium sp. ORS 278]|uniref:FdhF/YdeP family oxidoreductase n=1 Tax=Bradyrhizobium sp. (strain ORS 278) TaxID=114615 RepID=UPI0001508D77|nr:FdhF/YdeP family oxidoreductase [Bradyrhizobium sp. ORS 278]CAL77705.1 putative formate dehydrogenase (C-terminal), related to acid resistance with formate dehydrogenase/DMSO reductase, domains 1-3 and ADC-like domain [Bradyrhizobium sp. ORS 278]